MYCETQNQRLWQLTSSHLFDPTATCTCLFSQSHRDSITQGIPRQYEKSECGIRLANEALVSTSFSDDQLQTSPLHTIITKLNTYAQANRNTPAAQKVAVNTSIEIILMIPVKVTQPLPKFCKHK